MKEWREPDKKFWKNRKVFITGSTGFVGSWLTKELMALGADLLAIVPGAELYPSYYVGKIALEDCYLEDFDTLCDVICKFRPETVFHLGAQTQVKRAYENPLSTMETNIRGTYNLLEACRRCPETVKQIVIASSDKAYGASNTILSPYKEDHRLEGRYPYDVSKSCADLIAQSYHQTYNMPIGITRCGNIYGGGDMNWDRLVPGTIRSLYYDQSPVLRSDGKYVREYIYIEDVISAYLCLAENLSNSESLWGEPFNFSARSAVSVLELVCRLKTLMDKEILGIHVSRTAKAEILSQYLSARKSRELLGWAPQFELTRGLRETIKWYTEFFNKEKI